MALIAGQINPANYPQPDYSGVVRSAQMQAQGLANIGASIGGVIKDFGEAKKERKKLDAEIKASVTGIESAIKMGESLGIDVKSSLTPYLDKINDPTIAPVEAAAYAQQASSAIGNILNFGMKANELGAEKERYKQAAMIRQAELNAAANKPGPVEEIAVPGGTRKMTRNPITGVYEPIKVAGLDNISQPAKDNDIVTLVKEFEGFNPKAYNDFKQTSIGYGTKGTKGEVLTEEQATERLKSELSGHAERIKKAADLKGISLNQNQFNALISFDYNTGRGENLIERFGDQPNQLAAKILEYTKAGGKDLPGLVKRRQIESALFLTPEQEVTATPQATVQNQSEIGFTPDKPKTTSRIITGDAAAKLGGDPNKKYIIKEAGGDVTDMTAIPPDITAAEERTRAKDEEKKQETQRAAQLAIKSIDKFIDEKGVYNDYLDAAVGYGEEFATGVAKVAPFIGTQEPQERANQKELSMLVEKGLLDAASELKPVSNVDLQLLRKNRPEITDPPELWAGWLKDVRSILANPDSYKESDTALTPEAPRSLTDRLKDKIKSREVK